MKKAFKILRIPLYLAFMYGLYIVSVLTYATLTDWHPQEHVILTPVKLSAEIARKEIKEKVPNRIKLLTWNLGFGALGEETSFFYDGGEVVIQKEELCRKNVEGMKHFLKERNDLDFILLQEVDSCSRRNHRINMMSEISNTLNNYMSYFGINYNVDFIPSPQYNPLGETRSGILSLSKYRPTKTEKIAFDTQFEWPTQMFFLDRCFTVQNFPLENGKELIVMNTHCSAYDLKGGFVTAEIKKMTDRGEEEFRKGNYVIMGGDWNQLPPNYQAKLPNSETDYNEINLTNNQIPEGWKWVADPSTPTNRKLDVPYTKEKSYTTVIDHFMVSPNVNVVEVKTIDLQFQFTDHQPVVLEVELK